MKKYRIWIGENPKYIEVKHLIEAAKIFRKYADEYNEGNSGLEIDHDGVWDEWLDPDDQNIHEHIYMYGKEAGYVLEEDEEEDKEFEFDEDEEDSGTGKKEQKSHESLEDEDNAMYDKFVNALAGDPSESADLDIEELNEFEDEEEEENFEEEEEEK